MRTVWTVSCRQTVLKTGKHAYYYYYYYKGTDYSDASQKVTEAGIVHIKYNVFAWLAFVSQYSQC